MLNFLFVLAIVFKLRALVDRPDTASYLTLTLGIIHRSVETIFNNEQDNILNDRE